MKFRNMFLIVGMLFLCTMVSSCVDKTILIRNDSIAKIDDHYESIKQSDLIYTDLIIEYEINNAKESILKLENESEIKELEESTIKKMDSLCLSVEESNKIKERLLAEYDKEDYISQMIMKYFQENFEILYYYGKYEDMYAVVIKGINHWTFTTGEINLYTVTPLGKGPFRSFEYLPEWVSIITDSNFYECIQNKTVSFEVLNTLAHYNNAIIYDSLNKN